tara:strand:- start:1405 stop:1641 length:237 start_codon:yes stop_codon:yes gene_type:complete
MENTVITKIKNIINIRKEYVKSNFPLESRLETIKEITLLQMIVDEYMEEDKDYIDINDFEGYKTGLTPKHKYRRVRKT